MNLERLKFNINNDRSAEFKHERNLYSDEILYFWNLNPEF